jgi:hypothetical protein
MVVGTTLLKNASIYYSPQFSRGGNSAVFQCECLIIGTNGTLGIDVEHKNSDDISFTTLGSFTSIVAPGVTDVAVTGIKEQLRFAYTVGGTQAYSYVHFNMLAPAWRPY